ncbi:transposase [Albimonas sp. CAU 1670]|uniref:REP-associated tyrosine transposase n=1 Tax=Albimonas sp. CAU 1670 TaxID=3032599 RepID=UPI0023DC693E|nr:transposase [Albimonas sp. CAU 1670]MDF2231041.1 transposase [Albimonas sp. CAU 1670]
MFAPGATYFFTVTLRDRRSDLLVREVDTLRAAVRDTMRAQPFRIDAWVVLPDHLHAVWSLPEGDADFPTRWRRIRSAFSRALPDEPGSGPRRPGERGIWQRRYWEHMIRDPRDHAAHVGYCWFNPVRHGYVERPEDWPFSSYLRDRGRWAGLPTETPLETGERRAHFNAPSPPRPEAQEAGPRTAH